MASFVRTIVAKTADQIIAKVNTLSKSHAGHTLLFALSASARYRSTDLQSLVDCLHAQFPSSVGCLSAPLLAASNVTDKPLAAESNHEAEPEPLMSCSIALFEPGRATVFRSSIPGKADVQVGRWHAFRDTHNERKSSLVEVDDRAHERLLHDGMIDWERIWRREETTSPLPQELQSVDRSSIHSILYMSDTAYEGLANTLSTCLPRTNLLGLIGTSTPFITGRPVTLFHNGHILQSGAVGLALTGTNEGSAPTMRARYPGWTSISPTYKVTNAEGNLITGLDGQNPTQLLLRLLGPNTQRLTETGSVHESDQLGIADMSNSQIHLILGGDPARGPIALASDSAPSIGTSVQIHHRPRGPSKDLQPLLQLCNVGASHTLHFLKSPSEGPALSNCPAYLENLGFLRTSNNEEGYILAHTFLAASENGWVLGQEAGNDLGVWPWRCMAEGGLSSLNFP
ncbi:hypothetical protein HGRIS_005909 [Hohenbuehelia grisea]|uniref:FIST domain-containing protein n=1 Tax=Hohenbuehelia grisea TaxID=104357 RepID=A0ABR3JZQ1_9AGAR